MKAINGSHLYFEQISVDKEGAVIDSFTIIKDEHLPYKQLLEQDEQERLRAKSSGGAEAEANLL